MVRSSKKHFFFKILLVISSVVLTYSLTGWVSRNIIEVPYITTVYIVSGSILAYIVVTIYEKIVDKVAKNKKKELDTLDYIAYREYEKEEDKRK